MENDDFYTEEVIEDYEENDCLSIVESGFMAGYLSA